MSVINLRSASATLLRYIGMVTQYGMTDVGMTELESPSMQSPYGTKPYSEATATSEAVK